MAHQALMETIKDVPMDSLALINWKEASFAVNGDEEADDAFLMELLATFYHETLPRLVKILTAAVTYRRTPDKLLEFAGDIEARNIEKVFKDEAHAIKGSSANIRLWRLAKAAEAVELPCKNLIARGSYSTNDPERLAVLNRFCLGDREPLETLITQFKEFARFMEFDAAKHVGPSFDLEEMLEPKVLQEIRTSNLATYVESVEVPCKEFWEPLSSTDAGNAGAEPMQVQLTSGSTNDTTLPTSSKYLSNNGASTDRIELSVHSSHTPPNTTAAAAAPSPVVASAPAPAAPVPTGSGGGHTSHSAPDIASMHPPAQGKCAPCMIQ